MADKIIFNCINTELLEANTQKQQQTHNTNV